MMRSYCPAGRLQIIETDVRSLMDLFSDLAHADLEVLASCAQRAVHALGCDLHLHCPVVQLESDYNLTSANLVKMMQISQLMMQYMQWNVEQGQTAIQLLQEERTGLMTGARVFVGLGYCSN